MKQFFTTAAIIVLLTGCASVPGDYWARSGVSQTTLDADAHHCLRQIPKSAKRETSYSEQRGKRDQFISCMQGNGYTLRDFTSEQLVQMEDMLPQARLHYTQALMAEAYISDSFVFIRADPIIGE